MRSSWVRLAKGVSRVLIWHPLPLGTDDHRTDTKLVHCCRGLKIYKFLDGWQDIPVVFHRSVSDP
jgi:hypothetical protein